MGDLKGFDRSAQERSNPEKQSSEIIMRIEADFKIPTKNSQKLMNDQDMADRKSQSRTNNFSRNSDDTDFTCPHCFLNHI
jgi:hypothetical protein